MMENVRDVKLCLLGVSYTCTL